MGELSFTWDEVGDLATVQCLQRTGDPFACLEDISQTRLPFYIHAIFGAHHWISIVFSLVTMLSVYAFARRESGELAATLFAALYVTSPQLLAGGRMVLTHSAIIFTCFTTLSMLCVLRSARAEGRASFAWLIAGAAFTGLAGASSVLAAFNLIFLAAVPRKWAWRDLWFVPAAIATFFATTIIYLSPPLLRALIDALFHGGEYSFWNYLGLNTHRAPWFFPFLLLAIKVGPWLAFAFHRTARWFLVALAINLTLKGAVFGYETPHHQMQLYPLLLLFIAAGIAKWWRHRAVLAIAIVLFAVQVREVVRFFPNYLFYGAQYGERFIGEFYGPAVLHAQGREQVREVLESIAIRAPEAQILVADNNAFDVVGPRYVKFSERDPNVRYPFALVDRLYATHFHFPERDAYNAFLAAHYKPVHTTTFPPDVWVYRVLELR